MRDPVTALDRTLPQWHFREVHATTVSAPSERVFAAVGGVTVAELPLTRFLLRLRGLRSSSGERLLDGALAFLFPAAAEPGSELVLGAVAQPWRLRGGDRPRADLASFDEPGYAKLAVAFRLDRDRLTTETRVFLTDERSRRAFRRYWFVIRPLSGLIRREWLRAIRKRAEAPEPGGSPAEATDVVR